MRDAIAAGQGIVRTSTALYDTVLQADLKGQMTGVFTMNGIRLRATIMHKKGLVSRDRATGEVNTLETLKRILATTVKAVQPAPPNTPKMFLGDGTTLARAIGEEGKNLQWLKQAMQILPYLDRAGMVDIGDAVVRWMAVVPSAFANHPACAPALMRAAVAHKLSILGPRAGAAAAHTSLAILSKCRSLVTTAAHEMAVEVSRRPSMSDAEVEAVAVAAVKKAAAAKPGPSKKSAAAPANDKELKKVRGERDAARSERDAARSELDALREERERWLEERGRLSEERERLREESDRLHASMLSGAPDESSEQATAATAELDGLRSQMAQEREALERLNSETAQRREEVAKLDAAARAAREQLEGLRAAIRDAQEVSAGSAHAGGSGSGGVFASTAAFRVAGLKHRRNN
jgi:hypothetical protein